MSNKFAMAQAVCFGILSVGVARHLEMSFLNGCLIFGPLAFIFGCWLAREDVKLGF
jgi:hypothetical protein